MRFIPLLLLGQAALMVTASSLSSIEPRSTIDIAKLEAAVHRAIQTNNVLALLGLINRFRKMKVVGPAVARKAEIDRWLGCIANCAIMNRTSRRQVIRLML
jgi:hypothetical protein